MRRPLPQVHTLAVEYQFILRAARPAFNHEDADIVRELINLNLDWQIVLLLARQHRLAPMIYENLYAAGLLSDGPDSLQEDLRKLSQQSLQYNLMLSSTLVRIIDFLRQHDIRVLPLKGPVLALQAYGKLGLRSSSDIDLLISLDDLERCKQLLAEEFGFQPDAQPAAVITAKQHRFYFNTLNEMSLRAPGGNICVDLHWRVNRYGHEYFSATGESPTDLPIVLEDVTLANTRISCIALQDLMPYLCSHGSKHQWQCLFWLCDLAMVLHRHRNFDWDAVVSRAKEANDLRSVLLGLSLAHHLFGARLPEVITDELSAHPVVADLAAETCQLLFQGPLNKSVNILPSSPVVGLYWGLRLRPGWREKIGLSWHFVFQPGHLDWAWVRLPDALFGLYYLLRPLRLLLEYARPRG